MSPDDPGTRPPDDEDAEARDDETGAAEASGDGGAAKTPAPATWAGRRRATEAGEGGEADGGAAPGGLTDEIERVEQEPSAALDEDEGPEGEGEDDAAAEELDLEEEEEEELGDVDEAEGAEGAEKEPAADVDGDEPAEEPVASQTVEADTVALADREQAREAALAGLRARAAEHQAKLDTGAHATAAKTAPPAPAPPAETAPAVPDSAGEPTRSRALWPRFLAASLLIVISMATATSVSLLLYLTDIARGLSDGGVFAKLADQLTEVEGGEPQNILIVGSDKRLSPEFAGDPGRSDTTILLRVDPDKEALTLLSIPRDLKVNIPGHGIDKFNAAFSYGGPKLTLRTVTALTGLDINHLVNINFTGFADAVNAIDCVYIDVDRRYFIPPESGVAEINIEAGYQRLCGLKALQYVRFRHDDNDLVRSARQQDFLREARQKVPPSKLIEDRNDLIKIFTDYTSSDIDDPVTVLELLKTFLAARKAELKEVHFPAELGGPDSPYVTASEQAIKDAVAQFLGEGTPGPTPAGEAASKPEPKGGGANKKGKQKQEEKKPPPQPSGPAMIDATGAILPYAQKLAATKTKGGEPMIKFPLFYPTQVPESSTVTPTVLEASRAFPIDGPGDDLYRGYKFVLGIPGSAGFTEYYGISGTNWEDPPILENPSETRRIDGRDYLLFYDGDRLRLVGWKDKKASYWVNNTLLQTLDEDEMLAVATSMRQLGG